MNYFTDVYLKRINRFGNNLQSRIHGKMEEDFENKLKKSVNKILIYESDSAALPLTEAIVASKKMEQSQIVNYLMTRAETIYDNGFVYWAKKPFEETMQSWMVLLREQYETIGYNRYQVILLDNEITWFGEDGIKRTSPAHYIGEMDKIVAENFKIVHNVSLDLPSRDLSLVMPQSETIRRGDKIKIGESYWKVTGLDVESVPGVVYINLSEIYDSPAAVEDKINSKWSINSAQGYELTLQSGDYVEFFCSFNGEEISQELVIDNSIEGLTINKVGNKFYFLGAPCSGIITVKLKDNLEIQQDFKIEIYDSKNMWIAIVGPKQIKVLQILEFSLNTSLDYYQVDVSSENGCFSVERVDGNKVYLKGQNIGKDNILVNYNGEIYKTPLEVISPWM